MLHRLTGRNQYIVILHPLCKHVRSHRSIMQYTCLPWCLPFCASEPELRPSPRRVGTRALGVHFPSGVGDGLYISRHAERGKWRVCAICISEICLASVDVRKVGRGRGGGEATPIGSTAQIRDHLVHPNPNFTIQPPNFVPHTPIKIRVSLQANLLVAHLPPPKHTFQKIQTSQAAPKLLTTWRPCTLKNVVDFR